MSSNVQSFKSQLDVLAEKLDLAIGVVVTKIAIDAWSMITARTPVDTGRARASWAIKEGEPSEFIPSAGAYGPPSPPTALFKGTESVFITSSLDYIQYLEDGSSQQAPAGMIAITLAELEAEAENMIGQLP